MGVSPLSSRPGVRNYDFQETEIVLLSLFFVRKTTMPPSLGPRLPRQPLSPAARAMRLQRMFTRLQEGAGYPEIAAEERVSRERVGQIIRRAAARGRDNDQPDHARMQIARLTPALRLAAAGVAQGDAKAIPLLLSLVDRLDRYSDPDTSFRSAPIEDFVRSRSRPRRTGRSEERRSFDGPRAAARPAAAAPEAPGAPPEPIAEEGVKSPVPIACEPSA
jgi:hypothetical protein